MLRRPALDVRSKNRSGLAAALVALSLAGCAGAPLVELISFEPTTITPDRDGQDDVARLAYRVGRQAHVTVTLTAEDGAVHVVRADALRQPAREAYELLFGGVIDGRMLADGRYRLGIEAVGPEAGAAVTVDGGELTVMNADARPPQVRGLTVLPPRFTPNQDGIDDRVAISYALDEPAEVRLRIETADGTYVTDILADTDTANAPGDAGPHVYDYDAGVDADAPPPPNGRYQVVVEARDASGNTVVERRPFEIAQAGLPNAAFIDDVRWSATRLSLGQTLFFTATVRNMGGTPIRTRGPAPGYVYDNTRTFNQLADRAFVLLARKGPLRGAARVSADTPRDVDIRMTTEAPLTDPPITGAAIGAAGPESGRDADLATAVRSRAALPVRVCGIVHGPDRTPLAEADVYAFEADGDNGRHVASDADGRFCFDDLVLSPDYERTFARSPGALRVGFTYDDRRSDLDYPFRFQVGSTAALDACPTGPDGDIYYLCLMPDQTVRVQGAVRFVEAPYRRDTNGYLALLHEDVGVMHGPYGVQSIHVEYDTPRE